MLIWVELECWMMDEEEARMKAAAEEEKARSIAEKE